MVWEYLRIVFNLGPEKRFNMAAVSSYPRVEFVDVGTPRNELLPAQVQERFDEALRLANAELGEDTTVCFISQWPKEPVGDFLDPDRNVLLGVSTNEGDEPIDIIDLKGLDETTIKPVDALAHEMVLKVTQHLVAKRMEGIFISRMGSKFDSRCLTQHRFGCDEKGYLLLEGCRILYQQGREFRVIKAEVFHSNTICRLIEEAGGVRLFDDYDLVRRNCRGMFISTTGHMRVYADRLTDVFRADAVGYQGDYLQLERDELTEEVKARIIECYRQFPEVP